MVPLEIVVALWLQQYGDDIFQTATEMMAVNINIRDNANSDARAEVRGRLKGIVEAVETLWKLPEQDSEAADAARSQVREEVQACYLALLGFAPTGDELREILGE